MTNGSPPSDRAVPVLTPNARQGAPGLSPSDYFLLSRIDGRSDVRTLAQVVGVSTPEAVAVMERLRAAGLVQIPGWPEPAAAAQAAVPAAPTERVDPAPSRTPPAPIPPPSDLRVTNWAMPFEAFVAEAEDLAEPVEGMADEQKRLILYYHHHLRRVTYYDLFGVSADASREAIRSAYFRLSKAFHPDRWFRKQIGGYAQRLHDIFKWLSRAYAVLGNPRKRRGYDVLLKRGYIGEWQIEEPEAGGARAARATSTPAGETRGTSAVLVMKARKAEASGAWSEAADLYLRAVQLAPTTPLRVRLVECMLKAQFPLDEIDREVRAARSADEESIDLLVLDGEVARRLGDEKRAESCYRAVLAREPAHPVARMGLERLQSR